MRITNNNKRHHQPTGIPKLLRGITAEQIKNLNKINTKNNTKTTSAGSPKERVKKMANFIKKVVPGVSEPPPIRPADKYLTSLVTEDNVTKIDVPWGSFNAGLVAFPDRDEYILVYRPDEYSFHGCILDNKFNIKQNTKFVFSISNCADPRLIWTPDKKLLMIYSSTEEVGIRNECIRGAIIMDLNKSKKFIDGLPFRVSPKDVKARQKNWMPFVHEDKIFLIASICPHIIYELTLTDKGAVCEQKYESEWSHPWFYKEFLRGNTNAIQLDNGNYLATFHTAVKLGRSMHYYDNGFYVFEGKPPFKVLKCANKTYLPAESAVSRHFRKKGLITVCFPVGMVKVKDQLLISYGDNDSEVKIITIPVKTALKTTVDIYD